MWWYTLFALSLSNVIEQIDRYVFQVAPIPYINYASYEYSLLAGTIFSLVYAFGNLLFSLTNDYIRMSRIMIVALACFFSSLSLLFIPFVRNFWELALLRLVMGFSQSPITAFCASVIKDVFAEEWRGIAFGVFDSGTFTGFAFSLAVGTLIYDSSGWKIPYVVFGIIGIAYSILLGLFFKDPDRVSLSPRSNDNDNKSGTMDTSHSPLVSEAHTRIDDGKKEITNPINTLQLSLDIDNDNDDDSNENNGKRPLTVRICCAEVCQKVTDVLMFFRNHPSLIIITVATAIRFAGGYIYAYYIAIFFSDLYKSEPSGAGSVSLDGNGDAVSCQYSYNFNRSAIASPTQDQDTCNSSDYPYCIDESCYALNSSPWHNKGMDHDQFETSFAIATVMGSVAGCLLGGWLGDMVSAYSSFGVSGRMLVAAMGNLIAGPSYYLMYTLPFPYCFVALACGGFFGEMYYGMALAVLAEMVPKHLFKVTTALYISILIGFASNATLFVPFVKNSYIKSENIEHTFTIQASSTYAYEQTNGEGEETFLETSSGSMGLQKALSTLVTVCYMTGAVLFLVAVPFVKNDLLRIKQQMHSK